MEGRKFKALKDCYGLSDGGVASFTFKIKYLIKDKIYTEEIRNGKPTGYVRNEDCNCMTIGTDNFKSKLIEITDN